MNLELDFLPQTAFAFMLIFARTGAMVMLLPGIGDRTVPPRAQELVGAGASRAAAAAAGAGAAAAAGRAGGGPGDEGRLTASDIARVALRGGGCPVGGDRGDALPER